MYHDISLAEAGAGGGPARFSVPVDAFARQLDLLAGEGYQACSLRAALAGGGPRTVAITFDDGDLGQYERGCRALAGRGMTATFFVTTDWVGRPGYASWDQLREMRAAGMDIQSHTRSHPFLSELSADALRTELRDAKDTLDTQLQQDTDSLALPGGDWPRRRLRGLIAAVGYRVVATSRWGLNGGAAQDGLTRVQRCTVAGSPDAATFRRIVAGDPVLRLRRQVREQTLGALRSTLGPTRYATWRRRLLDALA